MQKILKLIFIFIVIGFLSNRTIFGIKQRIILTGPNHTGSNVFATKLTKIWDDSEYNTKIILVKKIESIQEKRLEQISNNRNYLAIIDAKTAYDNFKFYPNLRVISVLWENWLFAIGNSQKTEINFRNRNDFLIHENSFYFAKFWKDVLPKTKFKWFNKKNIPNLDKDFSEEIVIFSGPKNLQEIFYWLEKYAGIKLLSFNKQLIESIKLKYKWLISEKIPPNTYPYQLERLLGLKWHPVLVGHVSLSEDFVFSLLKIIFSQKEKINPHPLFKNLIISDNKNFRNLFSFHTHRRKK